MIKRGTGYEDVESGSLSSGTHANTFFMPKSSITVKGGNSPGTASKEPRSRPYHPPVAPEMGGSSSPVLMVTTGTAVLPGFLIVPVMVLIWYLFAIAAVTMSKKIMMEVQLPSMLCTCQFISAAIATKMLEDVMGDSFSAHSPSQSLIQDKVSVSGARRGGRPNNFMWQMAQIALSYTFGFIFTNLAFSVVTASFAETVKSAEPISSVLMGFVVLNEVASLPTYLTLIPICAGVAISCFHDDSFAINGFLYAAASNICFSGRAVLAKRLLKQYPGSISEVEMFRLISLMGLVVLVPLTIISEGTDIYAFFSGDATMTQTYWELLSLLFLNGCAYAVYNLTSFLVLARTSLVTHAVLNCFRRVFIIVFTSYYFNVEISQFNMLGVALAVLGVILFAYCKDLKGSNKGESDRE